MALEDGFITRKRASKLCLALVSTRSSMAFFCPRCGVWISTLRLRFSESSSSSGFAVFEIHRHMDDRRDVLLVQINLLEQRGEELAARRTRAGPPRKTRGGPRSARCASGKGSAPPAAAPRSRRRYRHRRRRRRPSSGARPSLPPLPAGRAARRLLRSASLPTPRCHPLAQSLRQVAMPPFQKEFGVAHRRGVERVRGKPSTQGPRQR